MKSLLTARPVLWFLFLFNAAVAVAAGAAGHHIRIHGQTLHGTQQIVTCAGMGIVALGAAAGLLRANPRPATRAAAPAARAPSPAEYDIPANIRMKND